MDTRVDKIDRELEMKKIQTGGDFASNLTVDFTDESNVEVGTVWCSEKSPSCFLFSA